MSKKMFPQQSLIRKPRNGSLVFLTSSGPGYWEFAVVKSVLLLSN